MPNISTRIAAAIAFLCLALISPRESFALSLPTPAPTAPPVNSVPAHIYTYVPFSNGLSSCYHVAAADSFNNACSGAGQPTPGPNGSAGDWATLSAYVTYAETDTSGMNIVASGGVHPVFYTDPAVLHGSLAFSQGTYQAGNGSSKTVICPNAYPLSAELTTPFYGGPIYMPTTNVISCSGNYYGSMLGDVNQASVNYWHQYIENSGEFQPVTSLSGYTGGSFNQSTGLYAVRFDDMDYPGDRFGNQILCDTPATSLGTSSAGATVTTCSDSRINSVQTSRGSNPYLSLAPYPDWMNPTWITGVQNLFRMPSSDGLKTVFNDYFDPTYYVYFNNPDHSNVEIAQCEGCVTKNGYAGNAWFPEYTWANHINAEIVAGEWGVKFHAFNDVITSVSDSVYNMASLYLGMRNPTSLVITEGFNSPLTSPNSNIPITPIVYIVPTEPINTPANYFFDPHQRNYNPTNTTPYTAFGVGTLKQSGGAYLREFAACYKNGVLFGACAAVVNPTSSSVTMPSTVYTYAHTVTWTGNGIVTPSTFGGGDTGAISILGSAAPTSGSSIGANSAYILTP